MRFFTRELLLFILTVIIFCACSNHKNNIAEGQKSSDVLDSLGLIAFKNVVFDSAVKNEQFRKIVEPAFDDVHLIVQNSRFLEEDPGYLTIKNDTTIGQEHHRVILTVSMNDQNLTGILYNVTKHKVYYFTSMGEFRKSPPVVRWLDAQFTDLYKSFKKSQLLEMYLKLPNDYFYCDFMDVDSRFARLNAIKEYNTASMRIFASTILGNELSVGLFVKEDTTPVIVSIVDCGPGCVCNVFDVIEQVDDSLVNKSAELLPLEQIENITVDNEMEFYSWGFPDQVNRIDLRYDERTDPGISLFWDGSRFVLKGPEKIHRL